MDRALSVSHMPLLTVIAVIVVTGVLLWVIKAFIPMDAKIRNILTSVVAVVLILWILQVFGILGTLSNIKVGDVLGDNDAWRAERPLFRPVHLS
jgi:hypothetical protein